MEGHWKRPQGAAPPDRPGAAPPENPHATGPLFRGTYEMPLGIGEGEAVLFAIDSTGLTIAEVRIADERAAYSWARRILDELLDLQDPVDGAALHRRETMRVVR